MKRENCNHLTTFRLTRQSTGMTELFTSHGDMGKVEIQCLFLFLKKIPNDEEEGSDLL